MLRLLPLLLLTLSGCMSGATEQRLTVRNIVDNAHALDGKEVLVSGWLGRCQRLSCGIFASEAEVTKEYPYYLSIGPSTWLDSFARRAGPRQIVLRARVHDRCVSDPRTRTIAACADRSGTLEPLALVRGR